MGGDVPCRCNGGDGGGLVADLEEVGRKASKKKNDVPWLE